MGFTNVRGVPGRTGIAAREDGRGIVIDGRAIAQALRAEMTAQVTALVAAGVRPPALATIIVGDDPASHVYVGSKHRACEQAGMRSLDHRLPADTAPDELGALIERLNDDDEVEGILLQLPLPNGLDTARFVELIDPRKDVDGLTTLNAGLLWQGRPALAPCTPSGVIELLDRSHVELAGCEAVIVGRSDLVGKPLAALLLARNATVTIAHSRTRDLVAVCRDADVLIAAVGVPRLLGAEHVKPGATVIDVGINRTEEGLVGDVDFDAVARVARAITPVPGGVGPMTIACLLANTLRAAGLQRSG